MTVPVIAVAEQAAVIVAELLDELHPSEAAIVWEYMGLPGEYPGADTIREILRVVAEDEGWSVDRVYLLSRAVRRAFISRDISALRLLLLLWAAGAGWWTTFLVGRADGLTPRAGHGATAPVRGSPFGRFALALPGAPPD